MSLKSSSLRFFFKNLSKKSRFFTTPFDSPACATCSAISVAAELLFYLFRTTHCPERPISVFRTAPVNSVQSGRMLDGWQPQYPAVWPIKSENTIMIVGLMIWGFAYTVDDVTSHSQVMCVQREFVVLRNSNCHCHIHCVPKTSTFLFFK